MICICTVYHQSASEVQVATANLATYKKVTSSSEMCTPITSKADCIRAGYQLGYSAASEYNAISQDYKTCRAVSSSSSSSSSSRTSSCRIYINGRCATTTTGRSSCSVYMNGRCVSYGRRRRSQIAAGSSFHHLARSLRGISTAPPYCYYKYGLLKYNADSSNTGKCSTTTGCLCKAGSVTTQGARAGAPPPPPSPKKIATTLAGKLASLSEGEKSMLKAVMTARIANSHASITTADVTDVVLSSDSSGNIVATAVMAPTVQSAAVDASVSTLSTNTAPVSVGTKSFAPTSTTAVATEPVGGTPPPVDDGSSAGIIVIVIVLVVAVLAILVAVALCNKSQKNAAVGSVQDVEADERTRGGRAAPPTQKKPKARLKPPSMPSKAAAKWTVMQDPASGREFYRNSETKETTWTMPVELRTDNPVFNDDLGPPPAF